MINMLRKGIKFFIQRVYFPQSYFESRHYGKRFNSIAKFKSLAFQLRAIYFHTFAVDISVYSKFNAKEAQLVIIFLKHFMLLITVIDDFGVVLYEGRYYSFLYLLYLYWILICP